MNRQLYFNYIYETYHGVLNITKYTLTIKPNTPNYIKSVEQKPREEHGRKFNLNMPKPNVWAYFTSSL